ncbi:MAG TPA: peptidase [Pirellulaceae bacterium]|nr:peptidase [Pirellulaceae bacterium]
MRATLRAWRAGGIGVVAVVMWLLPGFLAGDIVTLNNGMTIDGEPQRISSVGSDPLKGIGETGVKQILLIDNRLTRTFVPTKQLAKELVKPAAVGMERIPLQQRIPAAGNQISVVGMPLRIDPFDEWGRRIFSMTGQRGKPLELVQGITEITPRWSKVEAIQGINNYIWTMKIATSTIPREQLSKMLARTLDPKDPTQRLRIVRLYMQSERFQDAREELKQVIKDFPGLAHLQDTVKELHQLGAQRLLKEIELRRDAGQYRLAVLMLEQFPPEGVAGETLLKVRELLDDIKAQQDQRQNVLKLIDANAAALKIDAIRPDKGIIAEIRSELNINTLDRMADFLRLSDDPKMSAEQKMSLAISGWLLGSGGAIDNLEVSIALVKVRDLARQYMATTRQPDRDNIISQLPSEATIEYLAAIIAHMKPPVPTEVLALPAADLGNPAAVLGLPGGEVGKPQDAKSAGDNPAGAKPPEDKAKEDDTGSCAPPKEDSSLLKGTPKPVGPQQPQNEPEPPVVAKPAVEAPAVSAAQATAVPGLYKLTVNSKLSEEPQITYWVQVPPEYDPYRRYPCIVTLNGVATTPVQQIDWWAGGYSPDAQTRYGQATRHGYIVIAPQWTREHQQQYEFSHREHTAVLLPLRDACKRFAIDVDRVYLTGHSMGGTAAWDVGLSHPDLWAGVIPIVATAGKYITQYAENGKYVPMYFVSGEKDRATFENSTDWDFYLKHVGYDIMVAQYLGRGHEPFFDEIQNLFAWMGLHKREFFRKDFAVESLRPWDNFFWWVETDEPKEINMILPAEWGENPISAKPLNPAKIKATPIAPNGLSVNAGRSFGSVSVWLSPELVAFNNTLKVSINGKAQRNVQPRIDTLLEDVRRRGDRQHPYWATVSWPN